MLSHLELYPKTSYICTVIVAIGSLILGGCASSCTPDSDAYYGQYPEDWEAITLEHFYMHNVLGGPYFKIEHRGNVLTLDSPPEKGCAVVADGEKVHGWRVIMPIRRYRLGSDGMAYVRMGWRGVVIIRDGTVMWCNCDT
jgi:hypothetical protein